MDRGSCASKTNAGIWKSRLKVCNKKERVTNNSFKAIRDIHGRKRAERSMKESSYSILGRHRMRTISVQSHREPSREQSCYISNFSQYCISTTLIWRIKDLTSSPAILRWSLLPFPAIILLERIGLSARCAQSVGLGHVLWKWDLCDFCELALVPNVPCYVLLLVSPNEKCKMK